MRLCERCGRYYYYDSCPYCELTSGHETGKKNSAPSGWGYFWIAIIIIGFIAAVLDPSSIIPMVGIGGIIWVISRLGVKKRGKNHKN